MGVTIYEPPGIYPDEARREQAVESSGALQAMDDPDLLAIAEDARRTFGVAMAAISIVHSDWQYLIAAAGLVGGPYSRRTSFCGHVIQRPGEVFCVPDAARDPRFAANPSVAEGPLVRFYAGAPLVTGDGLPLGALCVFDPRPRACLPQADARRLTAAAAQAVVRLEQLRVLRGGVPRP